MKLKALALAAIVAATGSAFAATVKTTDVTHYGPHGQVVHSHKVKVVRHHAHRHVIHQAKLVHHKRHYAFVRHDRVHYAASTHPALRHG